MDSKKIITMYTGVMKDNPNCDVVSITLTAMLVWDMLKCDYIIPAAFPPPINVHRVIDASTPKPVETDDGKIYTNGQLLTSWMWINGPTEEHPDRVPTTILPNDYAVHFYIPAIRRSIRHMFGKFAPLDIVLPYVQHIILHEFIHYSRSLDKIQRIYDSIEWEKDSMEAFQFITERISDHKRDELETETETLEVLPGIYFPTNSIIQDLRANPFGSYMRYYVRKHPEHEPALDMLKVCRIQYLCQYADAELSPEQIELYYRILGKWKKIGKTRGRAVILIE